MPESLDSFEPILEAPLLPSEMPLQFSREVPTTGAAGLEKNHLTRAHLVDFEIKGSRLVGSNVRLKPKTGFRSITQLVGAKLISCEPVLTLS